MTTLTNRSGLRRLAPFVGMAVALPALVGSAAHAAVTAGDPIPVNPAHVGALAANYYKPGETCYYPEGVLPGTVDAWHFIAPQNANFTSLEVTFDLTGDDDADVTRTLGDAVQMPDASHAYVVTDPGARLLSGTATLDKDVQPNNFQLSHACPAEIPDDLPAPPTVTKTVAPSYTRDFVWSIDKVVDSEHVVTKASQHTANYTVAVDKSPGDTSDFALRGEISVTNPNGKPITITRVTDLPSWDPSLDDARCEVDPIAEGGVVITAGATASFGYVCDLGDELSEGEALGTNTASVDWAFQGESMAPVESKPVLWDFARADVTTVNNSATVSDLFADQPAEDLVTEDGETVIFDDYVFTYPRDVFVPDADCITYGNTAAVTGADGSTASDDASVTVCRATNEGGHTIGFWQNKNGQGFVKINWGPVRSAIDTYYQSDKHIGSLPADGEAPEGAAWVKAIVTADVTHDRVAMFDKQYLATVLSTVFAETKDIDLAGTTIKVSAELRVILGLDDQLVTVGELLTATKTHYSAIIEDDEQREALKDIFDALNNNEQPIFDDAVTA